MKIVAVNRNSFLSGDKCKTDTEFEQKSFEFSELVSRLSPGRNELRLTATIFILICCSIIGN